MRYLFPALACLALSACQAADSDTDLPLENVETVETPAVDPAPQAEFRVVPKDGDITLSIGELVAEPRNCIVPIRVENGTDAEVAVSMFSFQVTGPGGEAGANMFAQPTPAGEYRESRIILPGQTCDQFDTVVVSEVLCKSEDADCADKVGFDAGGPLAFQTPD